MENLTWKPVISQQLGSLSPDSPGNPKLTNSCNRPWPATVLQGPGQYPPVRGFSGQALGCTLSSVRTHFLVWEKPRGGPLWKGPGQKGAAWLQGMPHPPEGPRPGTGPCKVFLPEPGPHGIRQGLCCDCPAAQVPSLRACTSAPSQDGVPRHPPPHCPPACRFLLRLPPGKLAQHGLHITSNPSGAPDPAVPEDGRPHTSPHSHFLGAPTWGWGLLTLDSKSRGLDSPGIHPCSLPGDSTPLPDH